VPEDEFNCGIAEVDGGIPAASGGGEQDTEPHVRPTIDPAELMAKASVRVALNGGPHLQKMRCQSAELWWLGALHPEANNIIDRAG